MSTSRPQPAVGLHLFGAPRIAVGEHEVPLGLKRAEALLGYIAHCNAPAPRVYLAALLWPDADETTGRARLRRIVYRIDRLTGRSLFDARGDSLALRHDVSVDTLQFAEIARDVIAGGRPHEPPPAGLMAWVERASQPILQGVNLDSSEFDEWLRARRLEHERLLGRLLRHLAEQCHAQGALGEGIGLAERLLRLDPYSEPTYVLLMRLHAAQCNRAGVDATFMQCADALRSEFGVKPGKPTESAYLELLGDSQSDAASWLPWTAGLEVRFARSEVGAIAYATLGAGPEAIVLVPGFLSHLEISWEEPSLRRCLQALARRFVVVVFDRRGMGLSERLDASCTSEGAAADVLAILDHAGIRRAWLFGTSEGGSTAIRLAAVHDSIVRGLILFGVTAKGSWTPDHPWAPRTDVFDAWLAHLVESWGGPAGLEAFAPSRKHDPAVRAW